MTLCFPRPFVFAKPNYPHVHTNFHHSIAPYHPVVFLLLFSVSFLLLDLSTRPTKTTGPHPYHTRFQAWQAYSPAIEPTESQMGSHCASPPTSKPASFNEDAQMLSHSLASPIAKPDSFVQGFHMHSCSASPATLESDLLDGLFHMHSHITFPRTSKPDALEEVFHMRSRNAALPNCNLAHPDEDTQKGSHSRFRPKFDTASFGDNVYELTQNYFGPTK